VLGTDCGGIPNQYLTGFCMEVSCMPSAKDLFTELSMHTVSAAFIYFSQFISSLKVGAFLLLSLVRIDLKQ
ncbi:MAG: hypothetical protein ACP5NY_09405, partial [Thermocladium sp.]